MKKGIYRTGCILVLVLVAIALFSIGATAEKLSKAEQEKVQTTVTTFQNHYYDTGMTLFGALIKEKPELAVEVIAQLARTMPEEAVKLIRDLAKTHPKIAVRGVLRIASDSEELSKTSPKEAKALEAVVIESIKQMMEETPRVAAVAVVSLLKTYPEIGETAQDEAVAAGLKSSYLRAASPIAPY